MTTYQPRKGDHVQITVDAEYNGTSYGIKDDRGNVVLYIDDDSFIVRV